MHFVTASILLLMVSGAGESPYGAWSHGPAQDASFFPIAVWLQSPRNAAAYKAAGINVYVGLWRGPTDEQLDQLKAAGISVICAQNEIALRRQSDPTIIVLLAEIVSGIR